MDFVVFGTGINFEGADIIFFLEYILGYFSFGYSFDICFDCMKGVNIVISYSYSAFVVSNIGVVNAGSFNYKQPYSRDKKHNHKIKQNVIYVGEFGK